MVSRRLGAAILAAAVLVGAGALGVWRSGRGAPGLPVASVRGDVLVRSDAPTGVVEALARSVVEVRAVGCGMRRQATAVLLDDGQRSVGLTNQHVVAGSAEVTVQGVDDTVAVRGRIEGRDAVELDPDELRSAGAAPLRVGRPPSVGAGVTVAGFPGGSFRAMSGHVRAVERREGYGGSAEVLIVDVEAVPGISGGVVVDVTGRAVGLVAARDPLTGDVVAYPLSTLGPATVGTMAGC